MALRIIKGTGTIVWGTNNIMGSPAGAIVDSMTLTPKNGAPIDIEGNDGLSAFEVILRDGFNGKVSCIYDDTKTWPLEGANAVWTIPFANTASANAIPFGEPANGGGSATFANGAVSYTVLIAAPPTMGYNKKKEATISYDVTYRPAVAV